MFPNALPVLTTEGNSDDILAALNLMNKILVEMNKNVMVNYDIAKRLDLIEKAIKDLAPGELE